MKPLTTLIVFLIMICSTKAQYAIQIGNKIVPLKKGITVLKQELLSDSVKLLFLPDTAKVNSGLSSITILSVAKGGEIKKAYQINGNTICPFLNDVIKETETEKLCIVQTTKGANIIKPIRITITLTP